MPGRTTRRAVVPAVPRSGSRRSLSPQTLTRLADLAGLAATVLADLASTRGAANGSPTGPGADTAAPPARPSAGRTIPVTDPDDPGEAPRA